MGQATLKDQLICNNHSNNMYRFTVELTGLQDFSEDRITVTFPQTTSTVEVVMSITIPIINDDPNENEEGFYLLLTIDTLSSDSVDVANAVVLRNGVALVRIRDNDGETCTVTTVLLSLQSNVT